MDDTNKLESVLVPLLSIALGLMVGAVMMLAMGYDPIAGYAALFQGIFGNAYNFGETLRAWAPLVFTGMAVAFAFRTGLFNIGVEGQFIIGSLTAAYVGAAWNLPPVLHALVAILAAMVAAGLWASIAGYLKARLQVHEVITTIMLNYIAMYTSNYLIRNYFIGHQENTPPIQPSASLEMPILSQVFDNARIHWGIFLAIVFAVLVYWLLFKTTKGYELRAVGFNPFASEYAGMNVQQNIVWSMAISGALAGVAGSGEVLGVYGYYSIQSGFSGIGFDGIAVALIGNNHPFGILLSALLFGGLSFGATSMQRLEDIPFEIIRVVIALIIFFVAANMFVKWLIGLFRRRKGQVSQQ
ncbi:ABC transporter permease [Effusibacillus lacus]|uniref:Branched-chain amino acid ABC transporter permease n=1 Tax=Effusibacillus lacus TaxID=1348429 RepID=A0A292YI22_9BACL|nr:ABC transporter permease [Effusibacillus lacus]TCS74596.1 nucleoside ABC transporter membrane protein [Effusibacillus lacus]GAX88469.1 branched-chain amino acid ABC transporter permease [Effusibacillus lacus]